MPLSDYTKTDKNLIESKNRMLICLDIEIPSLTSELPISTVNLVNNIYEGQYVALINGKYSIPIGTVIVLEGDATTYHLAEDSHIGEGITRLVFSPSTHSVHYAGESVYLVSSDHFHVNVVKDNENLIWKGMTWYATDFDIDEIMETSKGEVPRLDLKISNVNRMIEYYIQMYDLFLKTHGYRPVVVDIYVVNTGNTVGGVLRDEHEISFRFELKQPKTNDKIATFTLGATSPYTHRYPQARLLSNQGNVRQFQSWECGVTGSNSVTCDRTFSQCTAFDNQDRYCGFPGMANTSVSL